MQVGAVSRVHRYATNKREKSAPDNDMTKFERQTIPYDGMHGCDTIATRRTGNDVVVDDPPKKMKK